MNVLVNGITLNVNNAYAERDTSTGIITCTISVPYAEMEYAELKALFKSNTEDIISTKDDGTSETFSGLTYANTIDDDANEVYIVKLITDEHSFQQGRNRQLEADKAKLEEVVASKNGKISTLNEIISEKDQTITEKEETITVKDTVIREKEVVIAEQAETIAALENSVTEKDTEIAELLTIAEEYADMLYAEVMESGKESEVE